MKGKFRIVNSEHTLNEAINELVNTWKDQKWLMVQITTEKQRSQLQNNALHMWLTWVAAELNRQQLDVRTVLSRSSRAEIPWTMDAVKEHLWRPVQQAYCGKTSTTKASSGDYPAIYEILNKALGQQFGIHVPWPSHDGLRQAG